MSFPPGQKQQCPICKHWVDVSSFASGQRVRCSCGINFIVRKDDVPDAPADRGLPQVQTAPAFQAAPPPMAAPVDPSTLQTEVPSAADDPSERLTDPARNVFSAPASGVQIQRLKGQDSPQVVAQPGANAHQDDPGDQRRPQAPSAQALHDAQMRRQYQEFQRQFQQAPKAPQPPPVPPPVPAVTAPAAAMPEFEGFTIVERLGQGGMGEVWKARRKSDGLLVAIKVLTAELANDQSLLFRFEKEVAALASLDHPGIVKLVHHDFRRHPPFFAMELCDGETLRERMCKPTFSMDQRLAVFSDLCRVLEHAHQRGVVHRDLKPDNVLFDRQGHLKLIDFGLATLINGDPRYQLTAVAMTMGTADYMPPEQRTDARSVDARGDVWSLGIMLYELIAGTLPVGHFKPLVERMKGLDPRIDQLVQRALVHDREMRLQSAGEMADAIDEIRAGAARPKPVRQPPQSTMDRFLGFIRRK